MRRDPTSGSAERKQPYGATVHAGHVFVFFAKTSFFAHLTHALPAMFQTKYNLRKRELRDGNGVDRRRAGNAYAARPKRVGGEILHGSRGMKDRAKLRELGEKG